MENRISVLLTQKLLESARKKKLHKVFFFNGYDIKIQKGTFPVVGINNHIYFVCYVLFILHLAKI